MIKMGKFEKSKTVTGITKLNDKVKSSEGSGMVTDQAKQLNVLSNQSAEVLYKLHDDEETDDSTTPKQDDRPPSSTGSMVT